MLNILDVNEDCLRVIFDYLDENDLTTLAEVSARFKQSAGDAFSKKYKNRFITAYITEPACREDERMQLKSVLRHFGNKILYLNIEEGFRTTTINHELCDEIIKYCSRTVVYLRFKCIREGAQKILSQPLPSLKQIFMWDGDPEKCKFPFRPKMCDLNCDEMESTNLALACTHRSLFPKLEHFYASGADGYTDANMKVFFSCCPQLRSFKLERCNNVTGNILDSMENKLLQLEDLGLIFTGNADIVNFRTNSLNLKNLKKLVLKKYSLSSDFLTSLANANAPLEELNLAIGLTGRHANDNLIDAICNLKKLTKIEIEFDRISDKQITKIAENLPKLTQVTIFGNTTGVSTNGIIAFISLCQHLTSLNIRSFNYIELRFDANFHKEFLSIVKNREMAIKLVVGIGMRTFIITKETIIKAGQ